MPRTEYRWCLSTLSSVILFEGWRSSGPLVVLASGSGFRSTVTLVEQIRPDIPENAFQPPAVINPLPPRHLLIASRRTHGILDPRPDLRRPHARP